MECLSNAVTVSLPGYLSGLPIPKSIGGWFRLGFGDWAKLVPFGAAVSGITYLAVKGMCHSPGIGPVLSEKLKKVPGFRPDQINHKIKKDQPKVYDIVDIEDIGDKSVFCRCWKSNSFPYCDGSHNKHNEETGDNVAPLIVKKSS